MDETTKNLIFKIFITLIVLIVVYFAYQEVKKIMIAKKVEKKMEKTEEKIGDFIAQIQEVSDKKEQ